MISIFVSSTFNDMQAERDMLHQYVLPCLQEIAVNFGETVSLIDLRWGVDTTKLYRGEMINKVVRTCLDGIDLCDDFVLCFLGTRYGMIPKNFPFEVIENEYGLVFSESTSLTELEIRYGILKKNRKNRAIVFIRDEIKNLPETLFSQYYDDNPLLDVLKENLLVSECICNHYSLTYKSDNEFYGIMDLAYSVLFELSAMFNRELKKEVNRHGFLSRTKSFFDSIIEEKVKGYLEVPKLNKAMQDFEDSNNSIFVFQGISGMGKSSFSAYLCKYCKDRTVIPFFCGVDANCVYPEQIVSYFIFYLSELLGLPYEAVSRIDIDKKQLLTSLLYKTEEEIRLVVDGIDQLNSSQDKMLSWMPVSLPDNVRIVITTIVGNIACQQLVAFWPVRYFELSEVYDKKNLLLHLFKNEKKEIDSDLVELILEKKGFDNYLYASMLVRSLVILDRYDFSEINKSGGNIKAINYYLSEKIKEMPEDTNELGLFLIYELGEKIIPDFSSTILSLLAVSDVGIRAVDLEALYPVKWSEFKFINFMRFLHGFLVMRNDGCIDFTHSLLKKTIKVFATKELETIYANYVSNLLDTDPLKVKIGLIQCAKINSFNKSISLILSNPLSEYIVNQFVELCITNIQYVQRLLIEDDVLVWMLDYVVPQIKDYNINRKIIEMLQSIPVNQNSNYRTKLYSILGDMYLQSNLDALAHKNYILAAKINEDNQIEEDKIMIQMKVVRTAIANTDKEVSQLKDTLYDIRKYMEQGYLFTDKQKLLYWQCRVLICIIELPHVFLHFTINLENYCIEHTRDEAYISFMMSSQNNLDDIIKENEIKRIIISLILDLENCKSPLNKIRFCELLLFCIEFCDSIGALKIIAEPLYKMKDILLGYMKVSYDSRLVFALADLNIYISKVCSENDIEVVLLENCRIWERYVFDSTSVPFFSGKYLETVEHLSDLYLKQGRIERYRKYILKKRNVSYYISTSKVDLALDICRRYPDEGMYTILEKERHELVNCYRSYLCKYYLKQTYSELSDLSSNVTLYHQMLFFWEELPVKYTIVLPNPETYNRILQVYENLIEEKNSDNQEKIEIVQLQLLASVYSLFGMYESVITENSEYSLLRPANFYEEKIGLIKLLLALSEGEILKIRLSFDLAKALFEKAKLEKDYTALLCNEACAVLEHLMEQIDEEEIIYPSYEEEEISLYKIKFLYCKIMFWLASWYYENSLYIQAEDSFYYSLKMSMMTYGQIEDSYEADHLLLYISKISCTRIMNCTDLNNREVDKEIDKIMQILNALE